MNNKIKKDGQTFKVIYGSEHPENMPGAKAYDDQERLEEKTSKAVKEVKISND